MNIITSLLSTAAQPDANAYRFLWQFWIIQKFFL